MNFAPNFDPRKSVPPPSGRQLRRPEGWMGSSVGSINPIRSANDSRLFMNSTISRDDTSEQEGLLSQLNEHLNGRGNKPPRDSAGFESF